MNDEPIATIEVYETEKGVRLEMDDPPVEAHGDDVYEALYDLSHNLAAFVDGVWGAVETAIKGLREDAG